MGYRLFIQSMIVLFLFSTSAFAKVRDFQFMEDLTFAMPDEISVTQGLSKAEARKLAAPALIATQVNELKTKSVVPTNITYGFNERFEISLEVPYLFLDNTVDDYNGLGDIALIQKLRMSDQADGHSWLSTAMGFRLEPPTGDHKRGLGNGKTDVEFFGIGMREIGFAKLLVNLGYNFVGGEYSNEFKFNGGVNAAITDDVSFLMEFTGVHGTKSEVYLAPGIALRSRNISFRVGTQFGLNDQSYKYRWNFSSSTNF